MFSIASPTFLTEALADIRKRTEYLKVTTKRMKITTEFIEILMEQALLEAQKGETSGEVPVGAVIAVNGEIIARAHNEVEMRRDASAHAEILAMREASRVLENWRLKEAVLCVTLEPCTMCIGALRLARVPTVVFGAEDPRLGALGSLYDLSIDDRVGPLPHVIRGIQARKCKGLLSKFFEKRRTTDTQRVLH